MNKTNIKLTFVLVIAFANLFLVFKLLNSDHMLDQKRNMEDVLSQKSSTTLIEKGKTVVDSLKSKVSSIANIVTRDETKITEPVKIEKKIATDKSKQVPKMVVLDEKVVDNKDEKIKEKVKTNE